MEEGREREREREMKGREGLNGGRERNKMMKNTRGGKEKNREHTTNSPQILQQTVIRENKSRSEQHE